MYSTLCCTYLQPPHMRGPHVDCGTPSCEGAVHLAVHESVQQAWLLFLTGST